MKKIFTTLTILLGIFVSQPTLAECTVGGCFDVKLEMIYVDGIRTIIQTNGTESNLTACTDNAATSVVLENSHSNVDKIYALLLTAYTSKLNVRLVFNPTGNSDGFCTVNYAVLENN